MYITFLGLGLMGLPMATNIAKKLSRTDTLTVWNRTLGKTSELAGLGVKIAATPEEAVAGADVVITMVTAAADLEEILFGRYEVAKHMKKGAILVDMETIGPSAAREIAKKLEQQRLSFADCPVTGSTPGAIAGTLTIFAGTDTKTFTKIKPVLEYMGKNIIYMGEVGSGQAIKMINNMLIAETLIATAEAMHLADAMHLSRTKVVEVMRTIPATSPMMQLKAPNYVTDTYPLLFSLANMTKDLKLALTELRESGKHLPYLEKAVELHEKVVAKGQGGEDNSIIIKALE